MIQRVTLLAISSFRATICSTTSKRTFLPLGRVSPSNTLADHKSHQKRNERSFSKDFSAFYHIEVSNAANPNSTQLTVSGPDVDGILASMTVALAVQGCSLVELHAAKNVDGSIRSSRTSTSQIKDTFLVVDRITGEQFQDDELNPLAKSLLESLKTPMNTLSLNGAKSVVEEIESNIEDQAFENVDDQITVLRSNDSS